MSSLELPSWHELSMKDDATTGVVLLSARDILFMLTALENHRWKSRYYDNNAYDQDENDAFLDKLIERLKMADFCQQMADCILDAQSPANKALIEVIQNQTNAGTEGNPEEPNPTTLEEIIVENRGTECSYDNLFGSIVALLDFANNAVTDLFEQLEVATNSVENTELLVRAIPIIGSLPIDELLAYTNGIQENMAEGYASDYTLTLKNQMACELFCIAQANCELDLSDILTYFLGKVSLEINAVSIAQNLTDLLYGVPIGTNYSVYASHALLFYAVSYGSSWLGADISTLQRIAKSFWNNPNGEHAELCEECPQNWTREINFLVTKEQFSTTFIEPHPIYGLADQGYWQSGQGWLSSALSGNTVLTVYREFLAEFSLARFKLWYRNDVANLEQRIVYFYNGASVIDTMILANTTGEHATEKIFASPIDITSVVMVLHNSGTAMNGLLRATRVLFEGDGVSPF